MVDDAAVQLFRLCLATKDFSMKFHDEVRAEVGVPLRTTQSQKLQKAVQELRKGLDEKKQASLDGLFAVKAEGGNEALFGQKIEVKSAYENRVPISLKDSRFEKLRDLSKEQESFDLRSELTFDLPKLTSKVEETRRVHSGKSLYDITWLERTVKVVI